MNKSIIENEWITLPDGRQLAARIWMPAGTGPFPAIFEYLPYRKRDGTASRDASTHEYFVTQGYACVRVDITGTGDSQGLFDDEYSELELSDGEDVLAWIAEQSWSDGQVGMIGISWGGFNGLQLAYRQPKALKAVVSVASTSDRYADDIHYMDGCLLSDNFNWACQMFAYLSRPADPLLREDWREDFLNRLENLPMLSTTWIENATRNAYWKHGSVCENWANIQTPVLAITGWADSYVNTPPAIVKNLSAPAKALIGPWEHRYAHLSKIDAADFHSEVVNWFDHFIKGQSNQVEDLPDYRTFMQEHSNPSAANKPRQGRWIAEQNWPSDNIRTQTLYLAPDTLRDTAQTGALTISTPANVGMASGYFCAGMRIDNELPNEQSVDDKLSTCFDTLPLDEPLELLGRAVLDITFSVDKPTAQICARLCDVAPDGSSQRITYRGFNLTHYQSHETPEYLVPGEIYQAHIALNECAHRLRAGHKLRLALSTSYWPILWPTPEATSVTLQLAACKLRLPKRKVSNEILPLAPGKPIDYPSLDMTCLREPSGTYESTIQEDGCHQIDTFDDFGGGVDPNHGLASSSYVKQIYRIHPEKPDTASVRIVWNFCFSRDNWRVEIDTDSTMTCDRENFYLLHEIQVTQGAEKQTIFTKQWTKSIPRHYN